MMRTALRRFRAKPAGDDGFSLIETLVASSIFGIFTSLVMLAVISMLTSTQKSQSLQEGAAGLENVFQKLDHQVRYANGIQKEQQIGGPSGPWFVEWQSQATSLAPQLCTQLKYDTTAHTLVERTWQPASPGTTTTGWKLLANNIVNDPTVSPFAFTPTAVTSPSVIYFAHQQLKVTLSDRPHGTSTSKSTLSQSVVSFTALNSSTKSGNVCQEVAPS